MFPCTGSRNGLQLESTEMGYPPRCPSAFGAKVGDLRQVTRVAFTGSRLRPARDFAVGRTAVLPGTEREMKGVALGPAGR